MVAVNASTGPKPSGVRSSGGVGMVSGQTVQRCRELRTNAWRPCQSTNGSRGRGWSIPSMTDSNPDTSSAKTWAHITTRVSDPMK